MGRDYSYWFDLMCDFLCCQVTAAEGSDAGDKESSVVENAQGDMTNRTAAPSQASTMMPASFDKNTSVAGDGKYKFIDLLSWEWHL